MSCGIVEILVATLTLALREGEGDGHLSAGLEPLSPERAWGNFNTGKRHWANGVAAGLLFLLRGCWQHYHGCKHQSHEFFHILVVLIDIFHLFIDR